jgi:HlyD family secretion protein
MKRPLRIVAIVVLLAAAAGAAALYLGQEKSGLVLTGMVTSDTVIVSAQVQGRLAALLVREGDTVKRGQVLARIEPEAWQADMAYYQKTESQAATQVSQARANVRFETAQTRDQIAVARANLAAAQEQVKQAEADRENARLNFEREERMYHAGAETIQAYDLARTAYDAQKARVQAANKQVQAGEATVALAESNSEQVAARQAALEAQEHQRAAAGAQLDKAKVLLGYTEVRAPIDGVIDTRAALRGEVVNPGQAIVTIIDPDDLWVRADVEETYIDRIRLQDILPVRLPGGGERPGVVFYRAVDADYATQRDVSRTKRDIKTFEVRLRCDNKDRALAVGMTAYVGIPLKPRGAPGPASTPPDQPTPDTGK